MEADSIRYVAATTAANRVGLAVTNYGFFGNNLISRSPSFEFPLGSGFEHMSRAGLWVGAVALTDTGRFTGVSAAIVDNAQGTSSQAETEFTPAGNVMTRRSRIANSRFYSPLALSDEDLLCEYSDQPARAPSGYQAERHTPLRVLVRQQVLGFSLPAASAFEVVRFTVVNQGPPLENVYVGLYVQLVSGDKNAYTTWPPSASSGPGSWYYKAATAFDPARRLYTEHFCLSAPVPDGCQPAYCPPWVGVQLLGVRPGAVADRTLSFHWWSFAPGATERDTDLERYALMSDGVVEDPSACLPGGTCSPIAVLAVGPFAQVDPGDSVSADFAFVAGEDQARLDENAAFAQFAADIDYRLPEAPPSPRVHVESGHGRVTMYWDDSPEQASDPTSPAPGGRDFEGYRLYLGLDQQAPTRVAQFDLPDTTGFDTGFDAVRLAAPRVVDGIPYRYAYTVTGLRDGLAYYGAITSYDTGDSKIESLESGISQNKFKVVPNAAPGESAGGPVVYPNPYRVEAAWDQGRLVRDHYLWFTRLPASGRLRIFTLAGDLVVDRPLDGRSWRGQGTRGLYDPQRDSDTGPPVLSGASWAWDLVSDQGQAVASGLYLYAVEDGATGEVHRGRFLIVKSDREGR